MAWRLRASMVAALMALTGSMLGPTAAQAAVSADSTGQAVWATATVSELPVGGLWGTPFNASPTQEYFDGSPVVDPAAFGYVEREFTISGQASIYGEAGSWGSDGRWQVTPVWPDLPYTTRAITRYPSDPARFNGTVIVEWMNESTLIPAQSEWSSSYDYFMDGGYAYIGLTAQNGEAGPNFLRDWNATRYGALRILTDGQSYDIFSDVARLVKEAPSELIGGRTASTVLGGGNSQGGLRTLTYINAFHPREQIYDGFLIRGRTDGSAPLGNGLESLLPRGVRIRTDNTTPVMQLASEGDVLFLLFGLARQQDNAFLRTWEYGGAPHIGLFEASHEAATRLRDTPNNPFAQSPECLLGEPSPLGGTLFNAYPSQRVVRAAWHRLNLWATNGTPAPSAPTLSTGANGLLQYDQYGNVLGGVRLPELDVPTRRYVAWNLTFNPIAVIICLLGGHDVPLPESTLAQLYPSQQAYVDAYRAAAERALNEGFLTPYDYEKAVAEASATPVRP